MIKKEDSIKMLLIIPLTKNNHSHQLNTFDD